jgi:DNA-binding transcriptional ArsR family regulator
MNRLDTASVGRLFADPSRVAMVDTLLDGRAHPLTSLARTAGVALSTAAEHLTRLERGGIVVSRREGRRRLVRLARPDVAAAYEALATLSHEPSVDGLRAWTRREELRTARTCYDHVAGRLGVALADAAFAAGAVGEDFALTADAERWFARFGVDLGELSRGRRPLLRVCTDWTERREHFAGALGAAICSAVLDAGWVVRRPSSRALRVTPLGAASFRRLGCLPVEPVAA